MPNDPAELSSVWFDAWRTKDAAAVERMIAADYVYVAPNGAVMDREAILAIIKDPTYGIVTGAHTEVAVVPLGPDVTLVRHHWRGRGTLRGQVFVDDHQCVMVWLRAEGVWRVQYEQASPVISSTQPNTALVERFFEDVLNGANPKAAAELLAPDLVAHHPALPGGQGGAAAMAELLASLRAGFPDLRYRVDEHVSKAERVVTRWTATGTHRGTFMNVPPTNVRVTVTGTDIFRVVAGRLAEVWVDSDLQSLLKQIGAAAPMSAGGV